MFKIGPLATLVIALGLASAGADPLPLDATHEDLVVHSNLGRGPSEPRDPELLERCHKWASAHGVGIYSYHERLVGNRVALFASCVRAKDGGLIVVGTVGSEQPKKGEKPVAAFVARTDAAGKVRWSKELRKKGYKSFEGMSAVEAPNGDVLVASLAYVDPATFGTGWVHRFSATGKKLWEAILPGRGAPGTGLPDTLRLLDDGTVLLEGHIYPDAKALAAEQTYAWTGQLDLKGKLTRSETGDKQ